MTTSPLVSIIIVTWNSSRDIVACLEAVFRQSEKRLEIIVVDNASADGTPELTQSVSKEIKVIRESVNLGYAEANNRGIRASSGRYILLLNPDCLLQAGFIESILQTLEDHPELGSASGLLVRGDPAILDSTGIQVRLSRLSPMDRGEGQPVDLSLFSFSEEILGPSGAAGFFRREALDDAAIDGEFLDPDFFAYYEDLDLAWRLQLRGWPSRFVAAARATHDRKGPSQKGNAIFWIGYFNRYLVLIKNASLNELLYGALRFLPRETGRLLKCLFQRRGGGKGLLRFIRLVPRMFQKRKYIQAHRKYADFRVWRYDEK